MAIARSLAAALVLACLGGGCGRDSTYHSPTAPPAPTPLNVAGTWSGTLTVNSASTSIAQRGGCYADPLNASHPSGPIRVVLEQTGTVLSGSLQLDSLQQTCTVGGA